MMANEKSESAQDNFGKFIHHFQPETKTFIRKLERVLIKLYRQNVSLLFNQICLNERLLPYYTHTYILIKFPCSLSFAVFIAVISIFCWIKALDILHTVVTSLKQVSNCKGNYKSCLACLVFYLYLYCLRKISSTNFLYILYWAKNKRKQNRQLT